MIEAFTVVLIVFSVYSLAIVLIGFISAKKSDKFFRIVFINIFAMYVVCLLLSSFLPTKLSGGENVILPFTELIEISKAPSLLKTINYLSHLCLNILCYMPLGIFVAILSKLSANNRVFLTAFIVTLIFSLSIEFVQYFIPFRSASGDDFISQVLGGILGAVIFIINLKKEKVKEIMTKLLP